MQLVGGNLGSQLLYALCLGACLHAFGETLPLASLILVNSAASLLNGLSPVPGGLGVVEAGLVAGLTAAGIPADIAVADRIDPSPDDGVDHARVRLVCVPQSRTTGRDLKGSDDARASVRRERLSADSRWSVGCGGPASDRDAVRAGASVEDRVVGEKDPVSHARGVEHEHVPAAFAI